MSNGFAIFNFTPKIQFAANANIKIRLTSGIKDDAGVGLEAEKIYEYTTTAVANRTSSPSAFDGNYGFENGTAGVNFIGDGNILSGTIGCINPFAGSKFACITSGNSLVSTSNSIVVDTLVNGDEVYCVLTSSESCISDLDDTSAIVAINVNSALIPSVSILANNTACAGSEVILVADGINAGTTPVYEWFVNGNLLSENSDSLTLSTLNDIDIVTCNLISSLTCATIYTVNSH